MTRPRKGTITERLVAEIRENGGMTSVELARITGVAPSTISALLHKLAANGEIVIIRVRDDHGGRRWCSLYRLGDGAKSAPVDASPALSKRSRGRAGLIATPRAGNPAAAAGPIDVYRPDSDGNLVPRYRLPAPSEAYFIDKIGEWAKAQLGKKHQSGGAKRGKPRADAA